MASFVFILLFTFLNGSGTFVLAEGTSGQTAPKSEKKSEIIVGMKNWVFSPEEAVVRVGETVIFNNDDDSYHKIHFEDPTITPSEMIKPGKDFRVTFSKEGTFPYYCKTHRDYKMQGKVIVRSAIAGGK